MAQTYIGAPIKRREDIRFITGRGTYVDDIKLPHMVHAAILRSPHAHARIQRIDASKAAAMPGVVSVFTLKDIGELDCTVPIRMYKIPGLEKYLQPSLARDTVRYVGEPVAVAVADTRYLAEDALDAIEVDYEILPEVMEVADALLDKVLVHEKNGTNVAAVHHVKIGDVDKAFQAADYTRTEDFQVHRFTGNPMETRGIIAHYDLGKGELKVYGATKLPHLNRQTIANFLRLPEHKCHFEENDVGGGFGIRGELYPEDFLIPFASVKLGLPVKWIEDRREHLLAANHSRQVSCKLTIAARKDGTLLAVRAEIYGDMGAYVRTHGGLVPCSTAALLTGPYRIPNYEANIHCVMTNKTGLGTLRAPGRVESCFYRERMLDMMARDLNIDPIDLRRNNLVQPNEIPYEIGLTRPGTHPTILDSGDYPSALEQALKRFDYDKLQSLQGKFENGRFHGIGMAYFVKNTGGLEPYEGARMVVGEGGGVTVYLSIAQLGQGHETAMAQICADALGVSMDSISVFHGNTDLSPFGWGTFASRGTVMAGNAVHLTGLQLKDKILEAAGQHLGVEPAKLVLEDGQILQPGANAPALALGDLVAHLRESITTKNGVPELEHTAYYNSNNITHTYGVHLAHVAVDPETGKLEVLKYLVVEDVGRAVNPLMVHGQTVGAAVQGIGGVVLEELVYGDGGQLLTTTFLDYLLPTSTDVPPIDDLVLEEAPSPYNPLGVKGAGEGGIVGTAGALGNAVSNALGMEIKDLPLSPDRIRSWIRERG